MGRVSKEGTTPPFFLTNSALMCILAGEARGFFGFGDLKFDTLGYIKHKQYIRTY